MSEQSSPGQALKTQDAASAGSLSFVDQFLLYVEHMKPVFHDARVKRRIAELAVASLAGDQPKTITSLVDFSSRYGNPEINHGNWSACYKVMSTSDWRQRDLSFRILELAMDFIGDDEPVMILVDDTILRKKGRGVPCCNYCRDPQSPKFCTNLVWGQRVLCVTILVRASKSVPYRSIPLFFELTPTVKIPSNATDENKANLLEEKKKNRMSVAARKVVDLVRKHLDGLGQQKRRMIVAGDGSFANKAFMADPPHDTAFVCRCRDDLNLYRPLREAERKGKQVYGDRLGTPAELAGDAKVEYRHLACGVKHQRADVDYKAMEDVRWRNVLRRQSCSVYVIKGQYYRKYGRRQCTRPAYLVMTGAISFMDVEGLRKAGVSSETMIEAYLLRWEIEVGFRDQKNWLGIGKAQVRNEKSTKRTPGFMSACYALLLLASMKVFGDRRTCAFKPLPGWRNIAPSRPSIRDLVEEFRRQVIEKGRITA